MSRIIASKQGSLFSGLFLLGCSSVSITYYIKNSLLLKFYTDHTVLLENDVPVNPSVQLMTMVSAVEQDVKSFTSENTPIQPFIVPGLRTIHGGTIGTFAGGVIGLPVYFEFNVKEDVHGKIKNPDPLFDKNSVEEIHNCFLLSEKAKKYGIAREILCINTYKVYIESIIPIGISFIINLISTNAPILNRQMVHPIGQCLFYTLLLVGGLSLWRTAHTITQKLLYNEVEESLASLGQEYIEGAIEFYSKALERSSRKLEWNDQNTRILNTISDKINTITSRKETSISYKLAFYQYKLNAFKENTNKK